jgi:hypothetical protein
MSSITLKQHSNYTLLPNRKYALLKSSIERHIEYTYRCIAFCSMYGFKTPIINFQHISKQTLYNMLETIKTAHLLHLENIDSLALEKITQIKCPSVQCAKDILNNFDINDPDADIELSKCPHCNTQILVLYSIYPNNFTIDTTVDELVNSAYTSCA